MRGRSLVVLPRPGQPPRAPLLGREPVKDHVVSKALPLQLSQNVAEHVRLHHVAHREGERELFRARLPIPHHANDGLAAVLPAHEVSPLAGVALAPGHDLEGSTGLFGGGKREEPRGALFFGDALLGPRNEARSGGMEV